MSVRLGYACINLSLKPEKICCNRTCRLQTIESYRTPEKRYAFLVDKSLGNLKAVKRIIEWHIDNNQHFYRLSSDMFPHITNPVLSKLLLPKDLQNYQSLTFAKDILMEIGCLAYDHQVRLTMHPGHWNQLASPNPEVVNKTIVDLTWHAQIFEWMELGVEQKRGIKQAFIDSTLCVHGGGVYGDKSKSLDRWKENFYRLPIPVQHRLALENCEKCYSCEDLLPICEDLKIPLIFDLFHWDCYQKLHSESQLSKKELLPKILDTWKNCVTGPKTPKFHVSEQAINGKIGKHSDYVERLPEELLMLAETQTKFDIMIEAKCKDLAVLKLLDKYPKFKIYQPEVSFEQMQFKLENNQIVWGQVVENENGYRFEFRDQFGSLGYSWVRYDPITNQIFPV